MDSFYKTYEKLQIVKERIDIMDDNKKILAAGEGISISTSCITSLTQLTYDLQLVELVKDNLEPITRYTPKENIPDWFKD